MVKLTAIYRDGTTYTKKLDSLEWAKQEVRELLVSEDQPVRIFILFHDILEEWCLDAFLSKAGLALDTWVD